MSDLIARLRYWAHNEEMIDQHFTDHGNDCLAAIDALEAAQAENAKLRAVADAARRLCPEINGRPAYLTNDYHWAAEKELRKALASTTDDNDGS